MGAVDSSSSEHSVPEVKVEMPPLHASSDHNASLDDGNQPQRRTSHMKRVQSDVGTGLRITFKVRLCVPYTITSRISWPHRI